MYVYVLDEKAGLCVGIHGGSPDTDDDFRRNIASGEELDKRCRALGKPLVWLTTADPGLPPPSPPWRKEMGDAWKRVQAPKAGFCLVTSSTLMAGALTAISWFLPRDPNHPTVYRAQFDQGVAWAEKLRGEPLPRLVEMEREARAQLAAHLGSKKAAA